jgi:hypothetical protein
MKLTDLQPRFLTIESRARYKMGDSLAEAHGIDFLCPKCFQANGGSVGTHHVICWFRDRGVPDDLDPKPGRWTPQGTGYEDLTFVPGDPPMAVSVLITSGCNWHGFVQNGEVSV